VCGAMSASRLRGVVHETERTEVGRSYARLGPSPPAREAGRNGTVDGGVPPILTAASLLTAASCAWRRRVREALIRTGNALNCSVRVPR